MPYVCSSLFTQIQLSLNSFQITCYVSQSVILGYLTNTFSDDAVVTNTPDLNATSGPVEIADTNRYLYIAGG